MSFTRDFVKKAPFTGAFFVCLLLIASTARTECRLEQHDEVAQLERVFDGDTIRLADGRNVRLMGINTPELAHDKRPAQPMAEQAGHALRALFGKSRLVRLKFGKQRKDRHGRTLAHVANQQGLNLAAELIAQGYGFAIVVPPNIGLADCYFRQEAQARAQQRGVWALPAYKPRPAEMVEHGGFQRVEGWVTGVGKGRKRLWLDLGSGFAIRIERRNLGYFKSSSPENWQGQRIRVRGWVSFYNRKFRMSLRHPLMIERLD